VTILGIPIHNVTMSEAVEEVMGRLEKATPSRVSFVSAERLIAAGGDEEFMRVLRNGGVTFAEGGGMRLAGRLLRQQVKESIGSADLFARLCEALADNGKGMFLLGEAAEAAGRWVKERHPGADIRGCHHGEFTPEEEGEVVRRIADSGAEALFVAMKTPLQEKWLDRNLRAVGAKIGVGVGEIFDLHSGRLRRMWRRRSLVGKAMFLLRVLRERTRRPPGGQTSG
jgi:N-acetylglucosaminyldiphosphoundecaprenol N-acetyl-beta-D-mannosaminyltransferase